MARHPQHDNIRKLKGDPNLDRYANAIDLPSVDELPEPPQWWDVQTVKLYEKKGAQLITHGMLTELDIEYLGYFCLLAVKVDKLWQAGETPSMSMYTQLNSFAAQLGLNPISRQKFKGEPKKDKSKNKYAKSKPKK